MKINRTYLFIAISSISLLLVLIIQVSWIVQTAQIKEEVFSEKANMVLARTADALAADKETYRKMETCIGDNEIHKTDSLFTNSMEHYNFHMDYSFQVIKPSTNFETGEKTWTDNVYKKRIDEVTGKNGLELNLLLPKKRQFILEEMGTMFITSVVLILVVLLLFWRTILSLVREKKISEHTTDFLNNMTHEFKTPLTNISLAGKMIMKDSAVKQDDKIKHYSEIILEENEKLRLQVEQVLSMTALERGEIPLQKTEIDLHAIIKDSLKYIAIQIENSKGNLHLNLNAGHSIILGDKTHLINSLCNLADNAIKYSKGAPHLTVETTNEGKFIIISISDKGIGIEKKYHTNIFKKYFRVPTGDVHNVKGFGLGLAYVKKIIELHQGRIELRSDKENGTTFTIKLPNV